MCEKWYSNLTTDRLSFLPLDTEEGAFYFACMQYAVKWAKRNREVMMETVKEVLGHMFEWEDKLEFELPHNFAEIENH